MRTAEEGGFTHQARQNGGNASPERVAADHQSVSPVIDALAAMYVHFILIAAEFGRLYHALEVHDVVQLLQNCSRRLRGYCDDSTTARL